MIGVAAAAAGATEFHVAVNGDDGGPGSAVRPFATVHRAQRAAREAEGAVTVYLRGGTHYLSAPLILTAEDSGSAEAPTVYAAAPGEEVVLSGGARLQPRWEPYRDGILQTRVPEGLSFDQLFVNGQRQPMARYPNYDPNVLPYNGFAADAFSKERAARWADPTGGFIHAMHRAHWGGYHYRITGKDADGAVTYEGGWQNNRQMGMHKSHRFVENIFEELDAPGEWFLNTKTNVLYFYPPEGLDLEGATLEVACLPHVVEFQGSQAQPVHHVALRGITFRHTARTFMETKEPLLRSDWTIYRGGAALLTGTEDCAIEDCEFDQVGGNGVFVNNYNRRVTVRGVYIHGAGASGVCFVGDPGAVRNPLFEYGQRNRYEDIDKTPGPKTDNYPADCLVEDCLIHTVSVVEKQAAGVELSMSKGITVRHCSIYDVGRAGINISEGTFGGHLIEFCDVFDTVRETGDHGSFNSWGRDRFWHLEGAPEEELPELALLDAERTVIRNSRWRCDHGWDIDLDDGSSNYEIVNNLCLHGGLKLREGFYRTVHNNVIVNNSFHPHVWYANSHDTFTRNIVMGAYRPAGRMTQGKWGEEVDRNLFTTSDADRTKFAKHGCDANSVVGDPLFVDPANGDYRVKEGSPALALGFVNFPMDQFGVQKPALKKFARTPDLPQPRTGAAADKPPAQALPHNWQGAGVKALEGEEFSAFGVSKEDGGVQLLEAPEGCWAAKAGLRAGDVIQFVNGKPTKSVAELWRQTNAAEGKPLVLDFVRGQGKQRLEMPTYVHVLAATTDNADLQQGPFPALGEAAAIKAVATRPGTANEPPAVLHDGKLAANYGPVFRNGVTDGRYKLELAEPTEVRCLDTWSFNQGNTRGPQRFMLFGSNAKPDPGWDVTDRNRFTPLAEVDTTDLKPNRFTATRLRLSTGEPLASFRWLVWAVQPVTRLRENTAYQELRVQ